MIVLVLQSHQRIRLIHMPTYKFGDKLSIDFNIIRTKCFASTEKIV